MNKEYIICSAIYFNDGEKHVHQPRNIETGFVVCGRRHHNCFATFVALGVSKPEKIERLDEVQGFLTNTDRFVDRIEGREIAIKSGQVKEEEIGKKLFSEDLY
jgi:hypothetical protein